MMRPEFLLKRARDGARNPRAFMSGWRFGRSLPPARRAGAPAPERTPGRLEAYFDAHHEGPGIWKWRHYFDIYERHLGKFVGHAPRIVEIGVYSGGSLDMWRSYFGEDCQIYGVDIEPACRQYARPGVEIFVGDQADPEFWRSFRATVGEVDIVIDDGGHEAHQQEATLRGLLTHIRPGGVYWCEDVHGAWQPFNAFRDGLARGMNSITGPRSNLQQHVGSVHIYPLVTVIEKPTVPVPDFESLRHGTQWQPFLDEEVARIMG